MGTSLRQYVAAELRAEMARQRRSNTQLASLLQVSPQSVSRRLSGDQGLDLDEVAAIADWLGVPVTAFLPHVEEQSA